MAMIWHPFLFNSFMPLSSVNRRHGPHLCSQLHVSNQLVLLSSGDRGVIEFRKNLQKMGGQFHLVFEDVN